MVRFIIVDVEAEGGISPFSGRMTEFGCVDVESMSEFHGVLWPSVPHRDNPAIPYVSPDAAPFDHEEVFKGLESWLKSFADRAVLVSDNNSYDGMWMTYYCDKYLGYNPFGHSSRRIGDLYAGLKGSWKNTSSWKKYRVTSHSHVSVEDARGNAEALRTILKMHDQKTPW